VGQAEGEGLVDEGHDAGFAFHGPRHIVLRQRFQSGLAVRRGVWQCCMGRMVAVTSLDPLKSGPNIQVSERT
jgi:hypothetical protein